MNNDFWKWTPEKEKLGREFSLAVNIALGDDLRISDNALYTEQDVDNAANEICAMEDAEWTRRVRAMFYVPPKRTTNNRKKKQRRK